jgi:hypothetical protein
MINIKFLTSLIAMFALAYGIINIQSFLDANFIKNDTPLKHGVNRFLNGHID